MQYHYQTWKEELMGSQTKAMAVLSFPAVQLLEISVKDLISSSETQAKAMLEIADMLDDQAAIVSLMDLSLEAEAFGCSVNFFNDEVPTIKGQLIHNKEEAQSLTIPTLQNGRCHLYIDAIKEVMKEELNRPVFAGVIGPFSLAGRLMDVSEIMMQCVMDPAYVNIVLEKTTAFLKMYIQAYKDVGANGVLLAEPLAGLLSPELLREFSSSYIASIVEELQTDTFSILYHNCGPSTTQSLDEIIETGCAAYHFGNAVSMKDILQHVDETCLVMGNIDPVRYFRNGSKAEMAQAVSDLLEECGQYPNFIASSGCDIPPMAKWENIRQFYKSVQDYNHRK